MPNDDRNDDTQNLIAELRDRIAELDATFDLRWKADMRAIKAWQAETGRDLTWPDHADLCVWLLYRQDRLVRALRPFLAFEEATRGMLEMDPNHQITQGSPMAAPQIHARDFLTLRGALPDTAEPDPKSVARGALAVARHHKREAEESFKRGRADMREQAARRLEKRAQAYNNTETRATLETEAMGIRALPLSEDET